MKKILVIIVLLILSLTNNYSFCSTYDVSTLKRKIKKRKRSREKQCDTILFHYGDLECADLNNKRLSDIEFHRSNLTDANLQYAKLHSCDFKKTNLTGTDFSYAYFSPFTYIREASIVEGANFYNATGLSNSDKEFLRENGAINVPEIDPNECNKILIKTAAIAATAYGIIKLIAH